MVERGETLQASPISVASGMATMVGDPTPVPMMEFTFHTLAAGEGQSVKEIGLIMGAEDVSVLLQLAYEAAVGLGLVPPMETTTN